MRIPRRALVARTPMAHSGPHFEDLLLEAELRMLLVGASTPRPAFRARVKAEFCWDLEALLEWTVEDPPDQAGSPWDPRPSAEAADPPADF